MKALTLSESTNSKSTAMNVLPFNFDPVLLEKFKELKDSTLPLTTNWLELNVASETVNLVKSTLISDFSSVQQHINQQEARFIIMKIPKGSNFVIVFVFSCPEEVHVRIKMTMSSSKVYIYIFFVVIILLFYNYYFFMQGNCYCYSRTKWN